MAQTKEEKEVANMQSERAQTLRETLTIFFQKNAPNVLAEEEHKVENLVARVVGGPPAAVGGMVVGGVMWSENELFVKLTAKYGGELTPINEIEG